VPDRLAAVTLPTDTQILITRAFTAPRHLVYRAWTTPELIARWWSADQGEVTAIDVDLRVGGTWRYVMKAPDGAEVAFRGVYREIIPDERIVSTEVYEGFPDAEAVTALTLADQGAGTMLTLLVQHSSRENRDRHVDYGNALQEAMRRLEQAALANS